MPRYINLWQVLFGFVAAMLREIVAPDSGAPSSFDAEHSGERMAALMTELCYYFRAGVAHGRV